ANLPEVARSFGAGVVLMHMPGTPQTMQSLATYTDVVREVSEYLEARLRVLADVGIDPTRGALGPGVGFGKGTVHNLQLITRLDELGRLGRPVCLGVSRKGFLGKITGRPVTERAAASVAVACYTLVKQTAHILRVHDVAETRDAVEVIQAI